MGQITNYKSYDLNGRVRRIQDANGVITDLTYTPRGWINTKTVRSDPTGNPSAGDATVTYAYTYAGAISRITQPDGDYVTYGYDSAHRLTDITDTLNNHIHYTLDAAGNRITEQTYNSAGTLNENLSRQYDSLNHLTALLNATSQNVWTFSNPAEAAPTGVTYTNGYDGVGNPVYSVDGTSQHVGTEQQYDALNRLKKVLRDHAGTGTTHDSNIQYAYDTRNNVRSIKDPDGLLTSYTYDGLDNLTQISSPDTGSTTFLKTDGTSGYDSAGNRVRETDARGIVKTYTYDAINRLKTISYPSSVYNVSYGYDEANSVTGCTGSFPIGRMTSMTDTTGNTTYCYDARGNVTAVNQTTNITATTTLSVIFTYTLGDRLLNVTYPSGDG